MSKKGYPIINFGKKYKEDVTGLLGNTTRSIEFPSDVDGVTNPLRPSVFKNNKILQEVDFNNCRYVTTETCYQCTNLEKIILASDSVIDTYAFYGCSNLQDIYGFQTIQQLDEYSFYGCSLASVDQIPSEWSEIPAHSFQSFGQSFSWHPVNEAKVYTYAFQGSGLNELTGIFSRIDSYAFSGSKLQSVDIQAADIGAQAFYNCAQLTSLSLDIDGAIGASAFSSDTKISGYTWNPQNKARTLGSSCFYKFGWDRETSDVFAWDMRLSTFNTVPSSAWGYNKNSVMILPREVTSIQGSAFSNNSNITILLNSLPQLASTNVFSNTTGLNILVHPDYDAEELKSRTNWTTYSSNISTGLIGIRDGEILQPYSATTGVSVQWYSDAAHTQPVTHSTGEMNAYYGVLGSQREVWHIFGVNMGAKLVVTDGSHQYDEFVPVGAEVTITPTPADPEKSQLFMFKVNGVDYTETPEVSLTADADIEVIVLYWDGIHYPIDPVLRNNTFEQIQLASKLNLVPETWAVGDLITVTYDGNSYDCRLIDKTGKLKRSSDGSSAHLLFEFVNALPPVFKWKDNSSSAGFEHWLLIPELNSGSLWDKFDPALKKVLEPIDYTFCSYASASSLMTAPLKIWLAREGDLFTSRKNSLEVEFNLCSVDEYYQKFPNDRAKVLPSGAKTDYFELSQYHGANGWNCLVDSSGGAYYDYSSGRREAHAFAPRFAL